MTLAQMLVAGGTFRRAGQLRAHFPSQPTDSEFSLVNQETCETCGTVIDPGAVCAVCEQQSDQDEKGATP
jgi:ribosomal protein L32